MQKIPKWEQISVWLRKNASFGVKEAFDGVALHVDCIEVGTEFDVLEGGWDEACSLCAIEEHCVGGWVRRRASLPMLMFLPGAARLVGVAISMVSAGCAWNSLVQSVHVGMHSVHSVYVGRHSVYEVDFAIPHLVEYVRGRAGTGV